MHEIKGAKLADRLKTAAEAKQALLAKLRPKPAAADPQFAERGVAAAAQLKAVRAGRQAERAVRKDAADAAAAQIQAASDQKAARNKAPTEAEAKDRRDAKYAARKSRRAS